MATPSYIQGGSHVRGITSAESGINISSFTESFSNEKALILDRFGGTTGFATDFDPQSTVSIEGEIVTTPDAVMSAAYATAMTIANSTDGYSTTTGDYFLESIELSASRDAFQSASIEAVRYNGVTAV